MPAFVGAPFRPGDWPLPSMLEIFIVRTSTPYPGNEDFSDRNDRQAHKTAVWANCALLSRRMRKRECLPSMLKCPHVARPPMPALSIAKQRVNRGSAKRTSPSSWRASPSAGSGWSETGLQGRGLRSRSAAFMRLSRNLAVAQRRAIDVPLHAGDHELPKVQGSLRLPDL